MNNGSPSQKPKIAISSCILGHPVRYDGKLKLCPDIQNFFQQQAELVAVCPEVEIGLSVPRPPVQLTGNPQHPDMTGRDNPDIDISSLMHHYCDTKPRALEDICGYIFKSKSPSCGIRDIPVIQHQKNAALRPGLFAQSIMDIYPALPICDETMLQSESERHQFLQQVLNYCAKQPTNSK